MLTRSFCWEGDAEFGDVLCPEPHTVKTIRDVNLTQVYRPKPWIGIHNVLQQPLEGPAEAHSFFWG
jgi:hypothetical protein